MQVRLSTEGARRLATLPAKEERRREIIAGAPLMLSEVINVHRAADADLDAGLVERFGAEMAA